MSLGKGLGSLIPMRNTPTNILNQAAAATVRANSVSENEIDITAIKANPHQPRREFRHQELEDLINSIKEHGILQPLIVTRSEDGYELIAGERRLKAAKIAGLLKVPAIVRQASELEKLELALIENIQRSDLSAIEKAEGYQKLVHEFGLTQEEAALKVGISRSAFANSLRLLKLPPEIQKALAENKITEGHAKILAGLENSQTQLSYFHKIINQVLSVRGLEQFLTGQPDLKRKKKKISYQDPQFFAWQEELCQKLSTKVCIKKKGDGGSIIIDYYSPQDIKSIIAKIKE